MRREPVRWAMPGVLLSMLLAIGVLGGCGPAADAADPMPRTPAVLVSVVLPASVDAVRPDVRLAAERLTGDGAAVWLLVVVVVVCALLAGSARRAAWVGGGAARPVGSSLIVLGALRGRAPPHVVR